MVNHQNEIVHSKNADRLYIPASTVKILTALVALDHWGKKYQFSTDFYYEEKSNFLWVKGYGDPFLISEELDLVVDKIKNLGFTEFDGIGIDTSYFQKSIQIDGQADSLNPYDAPVGAVSANFNTINVRVNQNAISSSEVQTPMTPLARQLSKNLEVGTYRINLGNEGHVPQYFAELLKAKLNRSGVLTSITYLNGNIPSHAELLFTHKNSHTLDMIVSSMLEFSNNFVANQLYLNLGASEFGAPARLEKSERMFTEYISQQFDWQEYTLIEGAGLSVNNRLSASHLIEILNKFKIYRELLPIQTTKIYAKTGTLKNVSTYAGYLNRGNRWEPFALMINHPVDYRFRERVALELLDLHYFNSDSISSTRGSNTLLSDQ